MGRSAHGARGWAEDFFGISATRGLALRFDLNGILVSLEKLLAKLWLPAGPDELINHKTILGFVLGASGAIIGWAITEPYQENFSFWRDFLILVAVGCFIWLFVSSLDNLFERSWRAVLLGLKRTIYVPFLIVLVVFVSKIAVMGFAGLETFRTMIFGSEQEFLKVFVLDTSGSMNGYPLETLKNAVKAYVEVLEKNRRTDSVVSVACVTFSDDAKLVHGPTTDYQAFLKKVQEIQASGQTNTAAGLELASTIIQPNSSSTSGQETGAAPKYEVILVSDGLPNLPLLSSDKSAPYTNVEKALVRFASNNIPIQSVGAGSDYDRKFMEHIAQKTNGKFVPANDVSNLIPVFRKLAQTGLAQTYTGDQAALPLVRRIVGWTLIGLAIGLGTALSRRSRRALFMGMIGGLLGGCLGAIFFEGFQHAMTRLHVTSGIFNRLGGFLILGSCIGFCVPFVESAGKTAWLRIVRGLGEGRLIILDRSPMILGRHELVDIPVFGDPQIDLKNVQLEKRGKNLHVQTFGQNNLMIRNSWAQAGTLSNLDTFTVGSTTFVYLNRKEAAASQQSPAVAAVADRIPYRTPGSRDRAAETLTTRLHADRRLPIYLVLDVSSAMSGAPIAAVNTGIEDLEAVVKSDSNAMALGCVSVIVFGGDSSQVVPLTPAGQFRAPRLDASSGSSLGKALTILGQCLEREVRPKSPGDPGDWKPLIFLMICGEPTDLWRGEAEGLRRQLERRPANLIAVGFGPTVTARTVKQLSQTALMMRDMSPETIRAFFGWISQSAKVASRSASQQAATGRETGGAQLPPPPQGMEVAV